MQQLGRTGPDFPKLSRVPDRESNHRMFCTGFWYSAGARGRPELHLEQDASPTMRALPCLSPLLQKSAYWRRTCSVLFDVPTDEDSDTQKPRCACLCCNRVCVCVCVISSRRVCVCVCVPSLAVCYVSSAGCLDFWRISSLVELLTRVRGALGVAVRRGFGNICTSSCWMKI